MKNIKNILKFILNGKNKKDENKERECDSRPCPECGEELQRMDRCANCGADITYNNGITYAVDWSEAL